MRDDDTPLSAQLALPEKPSDLDGWSDEDLLAFATGPMARVLKDARLVAGLILHRLRANYSWNELVNRVHKWEVSERTLHNWLAAAEAHYRLEPVAEVQARRDGQARRAIATKATPVMTTAPEKVKVDKVIPPPAQREEAERAAEAARVEAEKAAQKAARDAKLAADRAAAEATAGQLSFKFEDATLVDKIDRAAAVKGKTREAWVEWALRWMVAHELAQQPRQQSAPRSGQSSLKVKK